jgi:hypothetical protein
VDARDSYRQVALKVSHIYLKTVKWIDAGSIEELKLGDPGLYIQGNDVSTVDLK